MRRLVNGEEWEEGGKEGGRPHPKGHPFYPMSARERNHDSSQQMEVFCSFTDTHPVGGVIHLLTIRLHDDIDKRLFFYEGKNPYDGTGDDDWRLLMNLNQSRLPAGRRRRYPKHDRTVGLGRGKSGGTHLDGTEGLKSSKDSCSSMPTYAPRLSAPPALSRRILFVDHSLLPKNWASFLITVSIWCPSFRNSD